MLGITGLVTGADAPAAAGLGPVDFRYSLPWWQTAICLPDDPDKALVGKDGQLLFDFGEGGVRNFGLCVQPEIAGGSKWVRQQTVSPRAPIVRTWKDADGVEVLEETFVVTPKRGETSVKPRLTRTDGQVRLRNWAKPARVCSSAFTGIDLANNGQVIQLQLAVPTGSKVTAVFGLCEGWHKEPGKRPLVLSVEGGGSRTVDPVQDFGANQPGLYKLTAQDANSDGTIDMSVRTVEGAEDRNAILNALWVFDGAVPDDESIIKGEAGGSAFASLPGSSLPARRVVVLVTLKNSTSAVATRQPMLRIQSVGTVCWNVGDGNGVRGAGRADEHKVRRDGDIAPYLGSVMAGDGTRISASESIEPCASDATNQFLVRLPAVTLPPGASRQVAFTVDRHPRTPVAALKVAQARQLHDTARRWWEKSDLPFGTIQIPDAGIQGMVESSVRNIWQAREIKKGQPAFHVGPTVYRGLWVVDGSFLLESAALLGRGHDARAGVEYLLSHQKPDGSFDLLGHFWKENGIVLWAATRHAFLTQDKAWLQAHWPALQRVVKAIERMRVEASKTPGALNYGLLPGGEIDGGISNGGPQEPEYSNTHWCLAGLKAAIAAAHWIGDEANAASWQKEYDDFCATFRKAAARDTLKDKFGNSYVPQMMGNARGLTPQKGQWTFCHAVYPGQVFAIDDPLATSQMAMLRATKVEGMVFDTGWMKDGLWGYFASFYGHAVLWMGEGKEAAQVLYDFANHACPTRVWREEQKPVGQGSDEVGDMPHNWASAEFVRLTTHLLELDRGEELHLLEGMPARWLGPGMVTRLDGVLTPFGPLHMTVRAARDGKTATLEVKPLATNCKGIIVHLPDGTTRRLAPRRGGMVTFEVR